MGDCTKCGGAGYLNDEGDGVPGYFCPCGLLDPFTDPAVRELVEAAKYYLETFGGRSHGDYRLRKALEAMDRK